jgi:hypothetical protein
MKPKFMDRFDKALAEVKAWETEKPGFLYQVADFIISPAKKAAEALIPPGVTDAVRKAIEGCLSFLGLQTGDSPPDAMNSAFDVAHGRTCHARFLPVFKPADLTAASAAAHPHRSLRLPVPIQTREETAERPESGRRRANGRRERTGANRAFAGPLRLWKQKTAAASAASKGRSGSLPSTFAGALKSRRELPIRGCKGTWRGASSTPIFIILNRDYPSSGFFLCATHPFRYSSKLRRLKK